ncbi:MAG: PAS domain-containing protein, partial [Pseudomonadota bacterium]
MTDHHRPPDNLVLEAMDQARIGYARTDRDGVILFMSEAFAYQGETELVDRDQAFKIPWFQLDHASDARKDMRAQVWKHFISHDAPWSGIIQWHLQDGGIRFFQGTATHVGDGTAILVINDRTSKILADKKVEETIDLYRQVLKDLPVAVAVTDLEGKVTYINEFLPNRFDRPTEEFYGKTITESFGNGLTELAEKVSAQHIANNRDIEGVVLNLTQRDGGVGTWLVNARPLFDAKGNRMATLNVAIDRTESRRLREEHTRLTEAMFEAQKISTLNDFAGNLAHELSN